MVADCHAAHDDAVAQAHTITDDAALANADIRAQLAVHTNLGSGGNQHLQRGGESTCAQWSADNQADAAELLAAL